MKNLAEAACAAEIRGRIDSLKESDSRQWGKMSVEEMLAHVREAYVLSVSGQRCERIKTPLPSRVLKYVSLRLPVAWPRNLPTVPLLHRSVMPPVDEFSVEQARLQTALTAFLSTRENVAEHAYFGVMKPMDWMRWGYLHADHHLRQFGR